MTAKYLNLRGPISANTIYVGGQLAARDATVTLPGVVPTTGELKAMGTIEMPNPMQLEAMELAITKQGIDQMLGPLCGMNYQTIEVRWTQNVMHSDGSTVIEGCKAFMRAASKGGVPGLSLEVGSASENELTFSVVRYQLYVGGTEVVLADQLNGILRVNGRDYSSPVNSLL